MADDDKANRHLLEAVLTDAGYEVALVTDGVAALAAVAAAHPDLILLDLLKPGMSGLEVSRALKGDPWTARIPDFVSRKVHHDARQREVRSDAGACGVRLVSLGRRKAPALSPGTEVPGIIGGH